MPAHEQKDCPEDRNNATVIDVIKRGGKLVTKFKCSTCGKRFEKPTQG